MVALFASCSRPATSSAASQPPTHSRASLIVENSSVQPGSEVKLGIEFIMDEGWHIYWQNPGDSGEPPKIEWRLPAGVKVAAIEWPAPKRLPTTAGTDYGYDGTTVLLSSLEIPATAQPGSNIEVGGDLRWLVCHDVCIPQHTGLNVPLRIASTNTLDDKAHRFLRTSAKSIPSSLPASFRPVVTSTTDSFLLRLVTSNAVTVAEFFPAEEEQIDNGAPQTVSTQGRILRLTLKKAENLQHDPERLKGVIVLDGREAYQIDAPVQRAAAQKGQ
jgi:DsbC/DsbD-like thiol-disulfide interchange protein